MAPPWFLESMPSPALLGKYILDGKLWAGRDNFQMMEAVAKQPLCETRMSIQYQVYDITNYEDTFCKTIIKTQRRLQKACDVRWKVLKQNLLDIHTIT